MGDLIARYGGAIPIRQLRQRVFHNRTISPASVKKEPAPIVVKGGESIEIEKIEDSPASKVEVISEPKEKEVDISLANLVKVEDIPEEVNVKKEEEVPKKKRKYRRRKSRSE